MAVLLEVCVDSTEGILAAVGGGADRIELCSALELGGLTPSFGQMQRAAAIGLPVHALIRSRAGDFCFGPDEIATMVADIEAARRIGLAGVVIGAARCDGALEADALARMVAAASGMQITLHRVFDLVPDVAAAVETAVRLGCHRILTSGGAVTALDGADEIARICALAAGRIGILPAAGITSENVAALLKVAPVSEVHSACDAATALSGEAVALGFGKAERPVTDVAEVRRMRAALRAAG